MDIGRILIDHRVISQEQLLDARQRANGSRIDRALIEMGYASEEATLQALGQELDMEFVPLQNATIDADLLARFPINSIYKYSVLPLQRHNGSVTVATCDPFDMDALDELSTVTGFHLLPVLAMRNEIQDQIKRHLGMAGDTINELMAQKTQDEIELLEEINEDLGELAESALTPSVIRLVNQILTEAIDQLSSDVHIEPQENGLRVRFRVDGMLRIQPIPPEINQFASAIVTRLKIMSHLNIAEKRLPQDGRIKLRVHGREVDIRMSIIPMVHGEGIVMRILDKERMDFNLERVGMPQEIAKPFRQLIELPHGIVLVTGPTGSGKSTTLYSALTEIKDPSIKIITVEDPVEYQMQGISQIQVYHKIGLTFAASLRSILRHDPDVVLIGEIRDGETAQSAIQASLTGHLVFSTLHTNDAPGAYTRLINMGVEPYLVASTVEGVLAQRLIRKLCPHCKRAYKPNRAELPADLNLPKGAELFEPVGCRQCQHNGYAGRTGIYELLLTDPEIHKLCVQNVSAGEIRELAVRNGMQTLRESGWKRALDGLTSLDEVLRITKGDIKGE
jgi:general secretion pathway protein E/type IV pilus assembly protein PilB